MGRLLVGIVVLLAACNGATVDDTLDGTTTSIIVMPDEPAETTVAPTITLPPTTTTALAGETCAVSEKRLRGVIVLLQIYADDASDVMLEGLEGDADALVILSDKLDELMEGLNEKEPVVHAVMANTNRLITNAMELQVEAWLLVSRGIRNIDGDLISEASTLLAESSVLLRRATDTKRDC